MTLSVLAKLAHSLLAPRVVGNAVWKKITRFFDFRLLYTKPLKFIYLKTQVFKSDSPIILLQTLK